MLLQRECPIVPAGRMPAPAPLPNLRDALQRRAAIFGPVDADAVPKAPLGIWQTLGVVARRVVEALTPGFAS